MQPTGASGLDYRLAVKVNWLLLEVTNVIEYNPGVKVKADPVSLQESPHVEPIVTYAVDNPLGLETGPDQPVRAY